MKGSSRIQNHEDVPDCVEVCGDVEGGAVIAAAEPVDEEPEEASRRLRRTMSWSVSD